MQRPLPSVACSEVLGRRPCRRVGAGHLKKEQFTKGTEILAILGCTAFFARGASLGWLHAARGDVQPHQKRNNRRPPSPQRRQLAAGTPAGGAVTFASPLAAQPVFLIWQPPARQKGPEAVQLRPSQHVLLPASHGVLAYRRAAAGFSPQTARRRAGRQRRGSAKPEAASARANSHTASRCHHV